MGDPTFSHEEIFVKSKSRLGECPSENFAPPPPPAKKRSGIEGWVDRWMGNKIILYWEKSRNGITLILIFYLSIGRPSYLLRLVRNGERYSATLHQLE